MARAGAKTQPTPGARPSTRATRASAAAASTASSEPPAAPPDQQLQGLHELASSHARSPSTSSGLTPVSGSDDKPVDPKRPPMTEEAPTDDPAPKPALPVGQVDHSEERGNNVETTAEGIKAAGPSTEGPRKDKIVVKLRKTQPAVAKRSKAPRIREDSDDEEGGQEVNPTPHHDRHDPSPPSLATAPQAQAPASALPLSAAPTPEEVPQEADVANISRSVLPEPASTSDAKTAALDPRTETPAKAAGKGKKRPGPTSDQPNKRRRSSPPAKAPEESVKASTSKPTAQTPLPEEPKARHKKPAATARKAGVLPKAPLPKPSPAGTKPATPVADPSAAQSSSRQANVVQNNLSNAAVWDALFVKKPAAAPPPSKPAPKPVATALDPAERLAERKLQRERARQQQIEAGKHRMDFLTQGLEMMDFEWAYRNDLLATLNTPLPPNVCLRPAADIASRILVGGEAQQTEQGGANDGPREQVNPTSTTQSYYPPAYQQSSYLPTVPMAPPPKPKPTLIAQLETRRPSPWTYESDPAKTSQQRRTLPRVGTFGSTFFIFPREAPIARTV